MVYSGVNQFIAVGLFSGLWVSYIIWIWICLSFSTDSANLPKLIFNYSPKVSLCYSKDTISYSNSCVSYSESIKFTPWIFKHLISKSKCYKFDFYGKTV